MYERILGSCSEECKRHTKLKAICSNECSRLIEIGYVRIEEQAGVAVQKLGDLAIGGGLVRGEGALERLGWGGLASSGGTPGRNEAKNPGCDHCQRHVYMGKEAFLNMGGAGETNAACQDQMLGLLGGTR